MSRGSLSLVLALAAAACGPATPTPVVESQTMQPPETTPVTIADASASSISFERIASFPPPGWQIPRGARMSPDGKMVTYLQSESGSEQMALFAFDLATRKHAVLVRAKDLVDTDKPMSREEELRRERQRKRITGVTSYAWASKAPVMLLPLGGNVFLRGADGKIKQLTDSEAPEIDAKLCADGSKVAFVRGRELFVVDVKTGKEKQLTKDAPEGVTHGLSDFNGQEEFNEPSGFWWSPSCDRIAYLEVDERKVSHVPIMGYRKQVDLQRLRYPRAGTTNPTARLGVVDINSGRTSWTALPDSKLVDSGDQYLGRVRWSTDGKAVFFQRMSRSQQHVSLVKSDPKTGKSKQIVAESDPSWLDFSDMHVLDDGALLWVALRNGHRHLEKRNGDSGALENTLSTGDWDVSGIAGVDDKRQRVLFIGNKDAVLGRQLYAVSLAGGAIESLSKDGGMHAVHAKQPQHGWIDIHSALGQPPKAEIFGADGKQIGDIAVPDDYSKLDLRTPRLVEVERAGKPKLYGVVLEPRNKKPGVRYPAIVMVYGGPGVQVIQDEWNPRLLWQHLADRGMVIFQLDNRGSTGRGHAFETPLHKDMGTVELEDQLAGLDYLSTLDFVDPARVGIYGHSYGGYMAAMAMLRAPGRFKVGVAGSPVTDWRYYDTGYTERYMSTPQANKKGYDQSSLMPLAGQLQGKLFLIHALMDENVHFEHTAKLIDALVAADKDFDLLVYPGERHGYRGPLARRYAYRRVADYFASHL
jgi:dipeptidyl-peptidase-4